MMLVNRPGLGYACGPARAQTCDVPTAKRFRPICGETAVRGIQVLSCQEKVWVIGEEGGWPFYVEHPCSLFKEAAITS